MMLIKKSKVKLLLCFIIIILLSGCGNVHRSYSISSDSKSNVSESIDKTDDKASLTYTSSLLDMTLWYDSDIYLPMDAILDAALYKTSDVDAADFLSIAEPGTQILGMLEFSVSDENEDIIDLDLFRDLHIELTFKSENMPPDGSMIQILPLGDDFDLIQASAICAGKTAFDIVSPPPPISNRISTYDGRSKHDVFI